MPQRHIQRFISAFKRKNLLACAVCILITVVKHFSDGKKFDPELRTRFLTLVGNLPILIVVRMDVCMVQARKGGIPVHTRFVIG